MSAFRTGHSGIDFFYTLLLKRYIFNKLFFHYIFNSFVVEREERNSLGWVP